MLSCLLQANGPYHCLISSGAVTPMVAVCISSRPDRCLYWFALVF